MKLNPNLKTNLKQQKDNKTFKLIFTLLLAILVFTGVQVNAEPNLEAPSVQQTQSVTPDDNQPKMVDFATIPKKKALELEDTERKGFKYSLLKFFFAMLGVILSAGAIFLGLNFYKKFILKGISAPEPKSGESSLQSPKDFREAINLFLNKTDK